MRNWERQLIGSMRITKKRNKLRIVEYETGIGDGGNRITWIRKLDVLKLKECSDFSVTESGLLEENGIDWRN